MTDNDPNRLQPFNEFFRDQAGGVPCQEATAALAAVTAEVLHLKKKGAVTITVEVLPADDGGRQVYVTSRVKATPPEPKPFPAMYFAGGGGSLHREDPYQAQLPGTARTPDEPAAPRVPVSDDGEGDTE